MTTSKLTQMLLVDKLYFWEGEYHCPNGLLKEAAQRIEQLEADVKAYQRHVGTLRERLYETEQNRDAYASKLHRLQCRVGRITKAIQKELT
jgi:hypothetical protein